MNWANCCSNIRWKQLNWIMTGSVTILAHYAVAMTLILIHCCLSSWNAPVMAMAHQTQICLQPSFNQWQQLALEVQHSLSEIFLTYNQCNTLGCIQADQRCIKWCLKTSEEMPDTQPQNVMIFVLLSTGGRTKRSTILEQSVTRSDILLI